MTEIDVSECKHLKKDDKKKPICKSGGCLRVYRSCLCEENIDCDYRQLKRLEFENKLLRADYEASEDENEKLKEALEEIKNICKPVLKANTIEKLEGKHLTGKYNLAKEIMEVLKDE